jgi:hypothetical protein
MMVQSRFLPDPLQVPLQCVIVPNLLEVGRRLELPPEGHQQAGCPTPPVCLPLGPRHSVVNRPALPKTSYINDEP